MQEDAKTPDFEALQVRAAMRSPEEDERRQLRLDEWEVGRDAMALGVRYLSEQDYLAAHRMFVIAARYGALDARQLMATTEAALAIEGKWHR